MSINLASSNWFVSAAVAAIDYPQPDHTGGAFSTSTFASSKTVKLDSLQIISDPTTSTADFAVAVRFLGLISGSGASWVNGTLTLTLTNAFTNYIFQTGDKIDIIAGTNTTLGTYTVASRVDASNITLTSSIGALASGISFVLHGIYASAVVNQLKVGSVAAPRVLANFLPNGLDAGPGFGIAVTDSTVRVLCTYRIRA